MGTKFRIPNPVDTVAGAVEDFDDLADAIANPDPSRPLRNAIGKAGRSFCNWVAARPKEALEVLTAPASATSSLLCKPYWEGANIGAPRKDTPPFTGGQCSGVRYRVTGTVTRTTSPCSGGTVTSATSTGIPDIVYGPIKIFENDSPLTKCSNTRPEGKSWRLEAFNSLGNPVTNLSIVGVANSSTGIISATATFLVEPLDGAADSCGNMPPELRPGPNPPPSPTFPPGEGPGIDPDGQPFFFVPPEPAPFPDAPPVDIPPPVVVPPGGGDTPSEPPTGIDGGEGSENGEDDDFGEPPEGERWVGACIRLTTIPAGTGTIPQALPQKIFPEVVGNIRLVFDSLSGGRYDTPIRISSEEVCVWEPVRGLEPTGIRVNLKPGFAYTFKKFSVPKEN